MIVTMKKISLVLLAAEREASLIALRDLGVLHIDSPRRTSEQLSVLLEEVERMNKALRLLEAVEPETHLPSQQQEKALGAKEILLRLDELNNREFLLREKLERLNTALETLVPWGEFDPADIRFLRQNGVAASLYVLTKEQMKDLADIPFFSVFKRGALTGVICFDERGIPEAHEFQLPEKSASVLKHDIASCRDDLEDISAQRAALAPHAPALKKAITAVSESVDLEHARLAVGIEGELSHITGFVPTELVAEVEQLARTSRWALLVRDPEEDDLVPTLVKNRKAVGIIEPVFDMLGTIPGYREYDISFLFLAFFTVFFAMIIGDAGYGFVFLLGTLASVFQSRRKGGAIGKGQVLLLLLSGATILWGSLTGTWFGSEAIASARPFSLFVVPEIASFNPKSSETVKFFCFVIGVVQIIIAHIWNFLAGLRERPRIRAFAQLAWIAMISGIYFLVLNLVLDPNLYPLPGFALKLILGGVVGVILFSEQEGNFFRGVARGFGGLLTTFLDSIGAFADIISYIRLFAVGLATVEIARSFNAMASGMGSSFVGILGAILILGLGHTLNLAMGALAVIVHGIRLNMLEFSGHLGMEWTGVEYAPLRKKTEETT